MDGLTSCWSTTEIHQLTSWGGSHLARMGEKGKGKWGERGEGKRGESGEEGRGGKWEMRGKGKRGKQGKGEKRGKKRGEGKNGKGSLCTCNLLALLYNLCWKISFTSCLSFSPRRPRWWMASTTSGDQKGDAFSSGGEGAKQSSFRNIPWELNIFLDTCLRKENASWWSLEPLFLSSLLAHLLLLALFQHLGPQCCRSWEVRARWCLCQVLMHQEMKNITSGSLISSFWRAIPGVTNLGLSKRTHPRSCSELHSTCGCSITLLWLWSHGLHWVWPSAPFWSPMGGDEPHLLAVTHTFCLHGKQQWEAMSHPISFSSQACPWVDPHLWVGGWHSLRISHCYTARLSLLFMWPPWGESFLPSHTPLLPTMWLVRGSVLLLCPVWASSEGDPLLMYPELMRHEKWARGWCRKSMLKQRWRNSIHQSHHPFQLHLQEPIAAFAQQCFHVPVPLALVWVWP